MTSGMKQIAALAALALVGAVSSARADEQTVVNVALLDSSSIMGHQMMATNVSGHGMMSMSPGMMDAAPGMAGPVGMGMMSIRADADHVRAGEVRFVVTNWSRDLEHEMVVIRVDHADEALAYDQDAARVLEDKVDALGEVEEIGPGQSGSVTLRLKPGTYLLVCNLAGHFASGMVTELTVTQ